MANAFPQLFLFSKEIISGTILPSSFRRALLRQEKGPLKPTTLGSMFSSGTATSSMKIIPVWEALRENLPSIFGAERPGIPFSRMKPLSPPSVWAQTTKTSAMGEFVIQFLLPLTIQTLASESHRALVSMWPGSDPWFGHIRDSGASIALDSWAKDTKLSHFLHDRSVKGLIPVGQSDSWHHLLLAVVVEHIPNHDLLLRESTLEIKGILEVKERLWFKFLSRLGLCWWGGS